MNPNELIENMLKSLFEGAMFGIGAKMVLGMEKIAIKESFFSNARFEHELYGVE